MIRARTPGKIARRLASGSSLGAFEWIPLSYGSRSGAGAMTTTVWADEADNVIAVTDDGTAACNTPGNQGNYIHFDMRPQIRGWTIDKPSLVYLSVQVTTGPGGADDIWACAGVTFDTTLPNDEMGFIGVHYDAANPEIRAGVGNAAGSDSGAQAGMDRCAGYVTFAPSRRMVMATGHAVDSSGNWLTVMRYSGVKTISAGDDVSAFVAVGRKTLTSTERTIKFRASIAFSPPTTTHRPGE